MIQLEDFLLNASKIPNIRSAICIFEAQAKVALILLEFRVMPSHTSVEGHLCGLAFVSLHHDVFMSLSKGIRKT